METILLYFNIITGVTLIQIWFWGFICFYAISSFFTGYTQSKPTLEDLWASVIWPISVINILGLVVNGIWGKSE